MCEGAFLAVTMASLKGDNSIAVGSSSYEIAALGMNPISQ